MLSLKRHSQGDTLIEVTIAIGIFTLIAISVVAVVSVSTSGAQSALENTLTREEVDAQAEALRFIQSAYYEDNKNKENFGSQIVAQDYKDTKEDLYLAIWNKIVSIIENNNNVDDMENIVADDVLKFNPTSCNELYEDGENGKQLLKDQGAFILDLKKLGSYKEGEDVKQFAEDIVFNINEGDNDKLFIPASTYPQIEYDNNDNIKSVQGIYVVGVKDVAKTTIVSQDGEVVNIGTDSAYYDFYIRSCWYNSGSENLSKVSTSVRLRDPEAIAYIEPPEIEPPSIEEEEYTFDDISWTTYTNAGERGYYDACGMPYCSASGPTITQSHWNSNGFETDCEPIKGQHVTFPDTTSIRMIGSTKSAVSVGAYYDKFSVNKPFSLQVDVEAANIGNHPSEDGGLTISLSIVNEDGATVVSGVSAHISESYKYVDIAGTSERINFSSKNYNLLLEYDRGNFGACITEPTKSKICISAKKQIPPGSFLKVDYNMSHGSHCCSEMAVIKLHNIKMSSATHGSITF